ncbi:MAG: right-handed parallel beta-helix repeat-containing protein [Gammaproteobacteria bacterium]|nr:right-handed parallel beta-helix repeat-containing protein [Gammaproteobacteria bacterium]
MAFQGYLKQSTAVDVLIGPFVDDTDGKTAEAALTLAQADIKLSKNGQTLAQKNDSTSATTDADGYYNCELDATDTNTVGQLTVIVHESGALPVRLDYHVVEEAVYDAMYGASAAGPSTVSDLGTVQTGDTYALANGATGFAAIDTVVDTIASRLTAARAGYIDTLASLAGETRDANVLDQMKKMLAIVEHQRGSHTGQPMGNVLFVDPANGDTHANGNRGGITDPYVGLQDCIDNGVTDSNHDIVILLAGAAAGATTHSSAATITCDKRYCFIRGPGRDFIFGRTTDGPTFTVTAAGVEISGCQINTHSAGTGAGIQVNSADFFQCRYAWINDTQGHAIALDNSNNCVIEHNELQQSGVSGSGHGISLNADAGETCNYGRIRYNRIHDVQGDGIQLVTTSTGVIDQLLIQGNSISDCTDDGVDIVDTGSTNVMITDNRFGSITGADIEDGGTDTVDINNNQWGGTSTQTSGGTSTTPESYTLTTGTESSGTYNSTAAVDGTTHEHTDSGGTIDLYYQFDIEATGSPQSMTITGRINGGNDDLDGVYAYNWSGTSWDRISAFDGKNGSANNEISADLLVDHVGTGGNLGKVRIRFYGTGLTSATLRVDQIRVAYGYVPATQSSVDTLTTNLATVDGIVDEILIDTDTTIPAAMDAAFTEIKGATWASGTDTLEAIRDRGDAAWTTGAGGSSPTVGEIRAEMDSNSTQLAAIVDDTNELQADWENGGRLDAILDTAASGGSAPTAADIRAEIDSNSTQLAAILEDTASMGITKNAVFSNFEFPMVLSSDHYAAATGKTVTGQRSIDGGAFTGVSGTIAEVGSGVYQIDLLAADTNGDVITYRFSAADSDDTVITVQTRG